MARPIIEMIFQKAPEKPVAYISLTNLKSRLKSSSPQRSRKTAKR